jgi:hypothetical protein
MTLHDWSDIAIIAQCLVAVAAAYFVLVQIRVQHDDNKRWKTLDICAKYEFSEVVSAAAKKIKAVYKAGSKPSDEQCNEISIDVNIVLNYLDGIAIGVKQGLYIEDLARDHLKEIVGFYTDKVLHECDRFNLNANDFHFLTGMNAKWKENETYYCNKT